MIITVNSSKDYQQFEKIIHYATKVFEMSEFFSRIGSFVSPKYIHRAVETIASGHDWRVQSVEFWLKVFLAHSRHTGICFCRYDRLGNIRSLTLSQRMDQLTSPQHFYIVSLSGSHFWVISLRENTWIATISCYLDVNFVRGGGYVKVNIK